MMAIYDILLFLLLIAGFPVILPIILFSEKRRKTVLHRLTLTPYPLPLTSDRPIWIHALSVGEVLSAVPLVMASKPRSIVFSASTLTGFEMARKLLNQYVEAIFYFPYDIPICVRRAIRRVNPSLMIIVETDIWPNFLSAMKKSGIPVMLVNARLSERSFEGYRRLSFFTRQVFAGFSMICTQTSEDARRFAALGVSSESIRVTGNVKFDQPEIPLSDTEIIRLRHLTNPSGSRKIIAAGSTHVGEEEILAEAIVRLKPIFENILSVIAPRDPKRAEAVCRTFRSAGLSTALLSETEKTGITAGFDAVVIDRMGILRKLYAVSDIAFVGGSLVRSGGHNPIEPAAFSKPVLFGADMSDFREISEMLIASGGAIRVRDSRSFHDAVYELLRNEEKAAGMGKRAFEVFAGNKGAVERTVDILFEREQSGERV